MAIRRPPDSRTPNSGPPDSGTPNSATSNAGRKPDTTVSSKRARTTPVAGQMTGAADVAVSDEARRSMISEAAYLRAERRGFIAGYEVEDWLVAERELDALLSAKRGTGAQ
jgi:hypothetical protein